CHLAKKATPRRGRFPQRGGAPISDVAAGTETDVLSPLAWVRRSTWCSMSDEWDHRPPVGARCRLARHTDAFLFSDAQEAAHATCPQMPRLPEGDPSRCSSPCAPSRSDTAASFPRLPSVLCALPTSCSGRIGSRSAAMMRAAYASSTV